MRLERRGESVAFRSNRVHRDAAAGRFDAVYRPTGEIFHATPGSLDHVLTERYCLYASRASVGGAAEPLYRGEVDHSAWPLRPAEAEISANTLLDWLGLADRLAPPPRLLVSRRLEVKIWPLVRV